MKYCRLVFSNGFNWRFSVPLYTAILKTTTCFIFFRMVFGGEWISLRVQSKRPIWPLTRKGRKMSVFCTWFSRQTSPNDFGSVNTIFFFYVYTNAYMNLYTFLILCDIIVGARIHRRIEQSVHRYLISHRVYVCWKPFVVLFPRLFFIRNSWLRVTGFP